MFKYVWLNIATGEFSNSWNEEEYEYSTDEAIPEGWNLIKYECLNDEKFEFYDSMRLR